MVMLLAWMLILITLWSEWHNTRKKVHVIMAVVWLAESQEKLQKYIPWINFISLQKSYKIGPAKK